MSSLDSNNTELLRFITAGSVDDGKSTLIGRLLYDSKSLLEDQIEAVTIQGSQGSEINLANLTDGLRAEREQGITIDVAYRYFNTAKRKFIIADSPGHVQYTRNMVTAASTANLAIILIDARYGVIEQTRRHSYIASLLRIPHLVVCVNKMDLVDFAEEKFEEIKEDFCKFATTLFTKDIKFMPISALEGENVTAPSEKMSWYHGMPLLEHLEQVHIANDRNLEEARFPVQWVNRPDQDFRGYSGQVAGGVFKVGDEVVTLPSGKRSKVKEIHTYDGNIDFAFAPMSVTLTLEDEIDISRGDVIVSSNNIPLVSKDLRAKICWMTDSPLRKNARLLVKHSTKTSRVIVRDIESVVDISTLSEHTDKESMELNDIGTISFQAADSVAYDPYSKNRYTGGFVLIDPQTNSTVAAGMLLEPKREIPKPDYDDFAI